MAPGPSPARPPPGSSGRSGLSPVGAPLVNDRADVAQAVAVRGSPPGLPRPDERTRRDLSGRYRLSPRGRRRNQPSAGRELPFRLPRQAPARTSRRGEPGAVGRSLLPGDPDDGLPGPAEGRVFPPRGSRDAARGHEGLIFAIGYWRSAQIEESNLRPTGDRDGFGRNHFQILRRGAAYSKGEERKPEVREKHACGCASGGYDVRSIQKLLGHRDVKTTMIYTHVLNRGGRGVRSPADLLWRVPAAPPDLRQLSSQSNSLSPLVPLDHQLTPGEEDPDALMEPDVED
jgi:hypothetical protein